MYVFCGVAAVLCVCGQASNRHGRELIGLRNHPQELDPIIQLANVKRTRLLPFANHLREIEPWSGANFPKTTAAAAAAVRYGPLAPLSNWGLACVVTVTN